LGLGNIKDQFFPLKVKKSCLIVCDCWVR
jgi:hypothetical protein